jgi:hypothetical protein
MAKLCCTNLFAMSRTQEDLRGDPELAGEMDIDNWSPLVERRYGLFFFRNVAIYFCPWCGANLPTREDPDPQPRKADVRITIAPSGEVHATLDGERVDPSSIVRMAAANDPPGE